MCEDMCVACGDGVLNIRVGAIIVKDGKVLMCGNPDIDYYYSVGGRIKFGETAEQAVVREVFEETGITLEVDRLGFIHENYYDGSVFKQNKPVYEIAFYFYMKVPDDFDPTASGVTESGHEEFLQWIPIGSNVKAFPDFFKTELKNPERGVKHFVTKDIDF